MYLTLTSHYLLHHGTSIVSVVANMDLMILNSKHK